MATSVQKSDQRAWNPALFGASATLGEAYRDMPRGPASAVPLVVRMLENPRSRLALPGAIDLFVHYRGYLGRPLGELRGALGLRPEFLTQTYRIERERFPHTHASARLAA